MTLPCKGASGTETLGHRWLPMAVIGPTCRNETLTYCSFRQDDLLIGAMPN